MLESSGRSSKRISVVRNVVDSVNDRQAVVFRETRKERKKNVFVKIDILESIVSDALQILVITVIGVTFQDVSILFLCSIDRRIVLNAFQVGRRVVIRKAGFIPGWVVGP